MRYGNTSTEVLNMKNYKNSKSREKSKIRKVMEKKGFYIVLFTCAVLVGAVSILNRGLERTTSSFDDEAWRDAVAKSGIEEAQPAAELSAPAVQTEAPQPEETPAVEETTAEHAVTAAAESIPPVLSNPLVGGVLKEYSAEDLVYSETMKDWRTHNGLDIAGEIGAQVKAAADGVVEQVYEDDLLGIVVVIGHTGQTQTLYANLQSLDFIKVGRQVKTGDIIGGVGNSALSEVAEEAHLHFEVLVNKENVDPHSMMQV